MILYLKKVVKALVMREVKPVFKLENPSVGTRKERILTDEMLVAFCESRLEWLKDDIFDLFNEVSEYHESVLNRFEIHVAATPEIITFNQPSY